MSVSNFIPEVWSTQLLQTLRKSLIFPQLTNQNYQGEIAAYGDTVKIQTPNAITTLPYTPRTTTISYEVPTSATQSLLIDQVPHFAFSIEDVEVAQANVNIVQAYMDEAAYSMADTVDQDIAGLYVDAGAVVALTIATDTTGVRAALLELGETLSINNVPSGGRWLVVSPTVETAIRDVYGERMTSLGDQVATNGSIGFIEGFSIFMSNNVAITPNHQCLAGANMAITMAAQSVPSVEALRLEGTFQDGMRGALLYGRKVVRPESLVVLDTVV